MKKIILPKQAIIDVCNKTNTKKAAAQILNISVDTFKNNLNYYNIIFDTKHWKIGQSQNNIRQHPEINRDWLVTNWQQTTKSIKQLANEYNVSDSLIESRINFYKLKKTYKHYIDSNKLFNINDPHIWYLAGLFVTDGYFSKKHDMVSIELVGEDEAVLLNKIKEYYNSTVEVKQYHHIDKNFHSDGVNTNYWQISCAGLKQFFIDNFKMSIENKTFTADVPDKFPSEDCAKAYIRGCLDGDGFISLDAKTVSICTASEKFITGICTIVKKYANIEGNLTTTKRSNDRLYPIAIWRATKAKQLLTWVYSLENCFKLNRKYQRFLQNKN